MLRHILIAALTLIFPASVMAEPLFHDAFDDGTAWKWEPLRGNWVVTEDGWYQGQGGWDSYSFAGDESWTDYTFSLRAQGIGVPSDPNLRMFIVYFRASAVVPVCVRCGHPHMTAYRLEVWHADSRFTPNRIDLKRMMPDRSVVSLVNKSVNVPSLAVDLVISVNQDVIDVWLDGQQVIYVVDEAPIRSGKIGVSAIWDGEARFDDIKVNCMSIDSDGDGTADCDDECVNDPEKTAPGVCGCHNADTDTDGDGTPDCNDSCSDDPEKTAPGVCGCGVPDDDTDEDGIPDCDDGCSADPDKTVPGACGCGVPDFDFDGDGFADCENQPPIARCVDVVIDAGGACEASVNVGAVDGGAFDPDGQPIMRVMSPTGPYAVGTTSVTFTVTDVTGASDHCTARITVVDQTPPRLLGVPVDRIAECTAIPPPADVVASDDCEGTLAVEFREEKIREDCARSFSVRRAWSASDASGNGAEGIQTVEVRDTTAPVLSGVPGDMTVPCYSIPVPAEPIVTDNCDGAPSLTFDEERVASDGCAGSYTLIRTWTATDACGNRSSASQTLMVEWSPETCQADDIALDDIPPMLACPEDATIGCDSSLLPLLTGEATATDNCDAFPRISYRDSLAEVPCPADLARIWTAIDAVGNTSECTQAISVIDVSITEAAVYWTDPVLAEVYQLNPQDEEDSAIRLETGPLSPQGIAVDPAGRHVYWASQTPGGRFEDAIFRANLDLTGVEEWVATLDRPVDVALDTMAGKLYWTANRTIQRANLDGSNVETVIGGLTKPTGIALDLFAGKIYWTDESDRAIRRANLDGSDVELLLAVSLPDVRDEIKDKSLQEPRGIALDLLDPEGGRLYWTDSRANTISRANLDGSDPELVHQELERPEFIKVEPVARKLYWAMSTGQIDRSNLDGSDREIVTSTHHSVGLDIAFSQGCPSELAEACPRLPELLQIVDGLGGINPTTGLADTFISPLAEHVEFREIEIDVSVVSELVSVDVVWTGREAETPVVTAYISEGHGRHTIVLDRPLVAGNWALIRLTVRSRLSRLIGTFTIWIAHHPGDTNQDGMVDVRDATAFGEEFHRRERPALVDLNGDGQVDVRDATAFGDLWHGRGGASRPWAGAKLPD